MMSQLATMIKCEFLPRYFKISYAKYSQILENHWPRQVRIMNNNMGLESHENIPLIYEMYGKRVIFIRSRITLILCGVMLSPIHIVGYSHVVRLWRNCLPQLIKQLENLLLSLKIHSFNIEL